MYRVSRDGFSFLAMGFTGRAAAEWKEKFISAFGKMERELRRIAISHASPDWNEARQLGKQDRRDFTDAVQLLCERAHERCDSTTPLGTWEMSATRTVTSVLFDTNGERIRTIRERLTARRDVLEFDEPHGTGRVTPAFRRSAAGPPAPCPPRHP